jgi:hypothetical protein
LGLCILSPITQAQNFANFAAFVAIFLGFGRSAIDLTEGMFGVCDGILNRVQGSCHIHFPSHFATQREDRLRWQPQDLHQSDGVL